MKNSSKMLFFFMIIFSTMIILSSTSWLNSWMGLEINLISFISFIINKKINSIESSIIYFLIQSMASIMFLFSIYMFMFIYNYMLIYMNNFLIKLIMCSLMMKMGAAPFHFWLPMIMQGISWMNNYILMTWQKLGPLILIYSCWNMSIMTLFIITSMIIGAFGGFNQTCLKKMMAFSSINQISWLLISLLISKMLWMNYYLMYFLILLNMLIIFKYLNILFIPQLMNLKLKPSISMFTLFSVMSMGGLPPFLGFFPKMMIIMNLNNKLMMMLLIMFSLIILFYYLRIIYFSLFLINLKKNSITKLNYKYTKLINLLSTISMITNLMLMMFIFMK